MVADSADGKVMNMRAIIIDPTQGGPRFVSDRSEPTRSPGEALLSMGLAGVCDTDLQLLSGYRGFSGVPGHELVAEVLEADDPTWLGKRVVTDINASCGTCDDCRHRDGHHCSERTVLGIMGRDGAFAERLLTPQYRLVAIPDNISDEQAVFAEPLAAAAHVLDDIDPGGKLVVLGDGKLGLLIAFALCGAGADVLMVGHHESKLALARAVGAETRLESQLESGWREADVVVDATGSYSGLERALSIVRPRGTVVLKTTIANVFEVNLAPIAVDELRVIGSRCGDMQRAVDMLAEGKVDPTPLINARYKLDDGVAAFQKAASPGVLKVLLEP